MTNHICLSSQNQAHQSHCIVLSRSMKISKSSHRSTQFSFGGLPLKRYHYSFYENRTAQNQFPQKYQFQLSQSHPTLSSTLRTYPLNDSLSRHRQCATEWNTLPFGPMSTSCHTLLRLEEEKKATCPLTHRICQISYPLDIAQTKQVEGVWRVRSWSPLYCLLVR